MLYKRLYMKVKLIQPRMLKRPMDTDLKIRMSPHLGLLTVVFVMSVRSQLKMKILELLILMMCLTW